MLHFTLIAIACNALTLHVTKRLPPLIGSPNPSIHDVVHLNSIMIYMFSCGIFDPIEDQDCE